MKFIIADDHPLFRGALRQSLMSSAGTVDILEAGDFEDVKKLIGEVEDIDLLLLDLTMPGVSGLSGLVALRALQPALPVIIVSATDDLATIRRAMDLGASGFIPKSASVDEIREAVNAVLEGNVWLPQGIELGQDPDPEVSDLIARIRTLTPQQARVLGMLAEGLLNKQIAYELGVSEATIKAHVSAVLQKLGVDSRTQAVIQLSRIGHDGRGATAG
ncbi:MAG: response regulator [Phyllobacterium sp.]